MHHVGLNFFIEALNKRQHQEKQQQKKEWQHNKELIKCFIFLGLKSTSSLIEALAKGNIREEMTPSPFESSGTGYLSELLKTELAN